MFSCFLLQNTVLSTYFILPVPSLRGVIHRVQTQCIRWSREQTQDIDVSRYRVVQCLFSYFKTMSNNSLSKCTETCSQTATINREGWVASVTVFIANSYSITMNTENCHVASYKLPELALGLFTMYVLMPSVVDLRGKRDPPLPGVHQILSISCSFLGKFDKIVCWRPPPRGVGAPSSGKSWIRHWPW